MSVQITESIGGFMGAAQLKFGRLDFVISDTQAWFLEVNPNGQYGWLDGEDLAIHRRVLRALLDPAATIR
jgi:D-alanine-D-alanine ligase-like ATP-grasp enzyme